MAEKSTHHLTHPIVPYIEKLSGLIKNVHSEPARTSADSITVQDLPTPSCIVDFVKVLANCDNMLEIAKQRNVDLRPHIKTHKTIEGALLQLYGSALPNLTHENFTKTSKIVVSTLGEAEFYAKHGFGDILYASPITPLKIRRLFNLGNHAKLSFSPGSFLRSHDIHNAGTLHGHHATQLHGHHEPQSPAALGVHFSVLVDSQEGFDVIKNYVEACNELYNKNPHHHTSDEAAKTPTVPSQTSSELSEQHHHSVHSKKDLNNDIHYVPKVVRVWLDLDGGYHRTGINPEDTKTVPFLKAVSEFIKSSQNAHTTIQIVGIYYHGGNSYYSKTSEEIEDYARKEVAAVVSFLALCKANGIDETVVKYRAIGSTPSCTKAPSELDAVINEFHPGNYLYYDSMQASIHSCPWSSNASWILSSITSVYDQPARAACDAGALALSKDLGASHLVPVPEFGRILGYDKYVYLQRVTQELGIIEFRASLLEDGSTSAAGSPNVQNFVPQQQPLSMRHMFNIGQKIRIVPNHSCLSAACYSNVFVLGNSNSNQSSPLIDEWITAPRVW